jgi:hypothetical protein
MTTTKSFLMTAICALVLVGGVAAQALDFGDFKGPNCLESLGTRGAVPCPPPK